MKATQSTAVVAPEKLRPALHDKIEHMDGTQLQVLNHVLLQMEVETLAERLGESFDQDQQAGKLQHIAELVRQFRAQPHSV